MGDTYSGVGIKIDRKVFYHRDSLKTLPGLQLFNANKGLIEEMSLAKDKSIGGRHDL